MRTPDERRHQHDRAARVAAHAQHGRRPQARARARGAERAPRAGRARPRERRAAAPTAVEGQDGQQLELVAGARHEPRLEAARRADEDDAQSRDRGARSSSATAMPGKRWPPVPPAAMRIVRAMVSPHAGRRSGQAHAEQGEHERRAARADERQRDALGGQQAEHHADVDEAPAARSPGSGPRRGSVPKSSGAFQAARTPRQRKQDEGRATTAAAPSRPSSSPITAKMKSLYG